MRTKTWKQLPEGLRSEAVNRVDAMLVRIARERGEVCAEASREIAQRAEYALTKSGGRTGIWSVFLPEDRRRF